MVGSSVVEVGVKSGLDATVGGLVWVRRKNGSWWPGQIVGEEELTEADLAIPRSGTPIKLLGRDDTSLDWFDLETTKAVKTFRCGDYDSCIEKAKVSAANNSLKFTKYPRRENAIVCALEIEKIRGVVDHPNGERWQNGENGSAYMSDHVNESEYSPEETSSEEMIGAFDDIPNSTQELSLSHSGISYEETNGITHMKGMNTRGRKRKTPNDSEDEGYEGNKRMKGLNDLGRVSEKKELILGLPDLSPENSSFGNNLCVANGMSTESLGNGSSPLTLKKKRSQVVHIHELLKREYPRRPITKVLENTAMVPVKIICDESANPFERSDAISSSYECEDNNMLRYAELSNVLLPEVDFHDMLVDVPFVEGELHSFGFSPAYQSSFRDPSRNISVQASSFVNDEPGLASFSARYITQTQNTEKSASKWQSKGKRNARHLSKGEESHYRWKSDVHDILDVQENPGRSSPSSSCLVNGFTDHKNHNSMASQRLLPLQQSRFSPHSNFEMSDADSLLYEVEVTVEATRSPAQHVPYISLMSKLNGKPVTGHPVSVEVLEGSCDLQSSDYQPSGSCGLDDEGVEVEAIVVPKSHKKKKTKHRSRLHRRKSSKSKKRHGSSSKKTRKLSSLTEAHKLSLGKSKPMSQTSQGPTLACIPLKVVFSRINEALNGSRPSHRMSNT